MLSRHSSRPLRHGAVFAVSCLLLDEMNMYDEVDVFDAVRNLRKTHPCLIRELVSFPSPIVTVKVK